ncbi:hypothetical protein IC235_20095 [Hymenobacter sp. BT664]|uniref:Outer membrane protein beta-barrel domain-containing protein n=1 Tax=Hymenobacter montanus TaxID=2771359 RepID=A0A927BHK7_9BACT|nr:hypothetical protein [Hymenobacter montanus]MBD2770193.1 hypothetical protein [Hymenobacter montanus]
MKKYFCSLLALTSLAALPLAAAQAQTTRKPAAKPAAKPPVKPAAKPAAPPTGTAAPAPAPRPAPAPAPAARPNSVAAGGGTFEVGTNVVNLGIGLGNRYSYGVGFLGGSTSVGPAISLSYERGIMPLGPGVLGVGGFVGYQGATYSFIGDKWKYTDVTIMVRGAFHYPVLPQLDAYGGLGLGLRHAGVSFEGSSFYNTGTASANELASGLFAGGRYFFSENIGAFAELGYDQTYLKAGLTAKF